MKRLSKAQKDAAGHGNGTALVLSGPGSGKTTVITARAARLALSGCAGRGRLLTLTFSRAAAAEMETRYRKIIKSCPEAGGACDDFGFVFKTLHSYCAGILKKYYKKQGKHFRILADGKQKNVLIKNIYFSLNGNGDAELETHGVLAEGNTRCARGDGNTPRALNEGNAGRDRTVENIVSWVSKMKVAKSSGECFCIKDFYQKNGVEVRNFEKIYESYEKYKRENFLIDFDDMIIEAERKLRCDAAFREAVSAEHDFIQVDEGQDLSFMQIEILKMIGHHGNIFMVADDDQGIYGFRGADTNGLKNFECSAKHCKKYYLEENFRSTKNIVGAASVFIKQNNNRYEKNIYTNNDMGQKIELLCAADSYSQACFVSELAVKNAMRKKTTGILYRNNLSALIPAAVLDNMIKRKDIDGIISGFSVSGGFPSVWSSFAIRAFVKEAGLFAESNGGAGAPSKMILKKITEAGFFEPQRNRAGDGAEYRKEFHYIEEYIRIMCRIYRYANVCKAAIMNPVKAQREGYIFFSTVHSSKGLEYDEVAVIDVYENEFPSADSSVGDALEEERRLFYVAMTRAKEKLYILYPESFGGKVNYPGIFFTESMKALKELRA